MKKQDWQQKGAGHRARLRDKFLEIGAEGFSDAEVLELLLSFGTPRTDCKEPARLALKKFGSFSAVLEAPREALLRIPGIGPKNSFAINFVQAVSRRYLRQRLIGRTFLRSSNEVRDYLLHSMRDLPREVLTVIFLDSAHTVLTSEILAEGTINVNTVYPREIVKRALELNAAALIVAHNHPSGSMNPSPQDLHLTRSLALLCSMMHIALLDHFIIGEGAYSFADQGVMATIQEDVAKTLSQTAAL
ncbi:MAG: DNA repair protein RadC [Desulfopila sp.]|nr:DNA repair protein RadC [Desulfopila sp.]